VVPAAAPVPPQQQWTRKPKRRFVPGANRSAPSDGSAAAGPGPPSVVTGGAAGPATPAEPTVPAIAPDGISGPGLLPTGPEEPSVPRIDPAGIPRPGYTVPGRPVRFVSEGGGSLPPRAMHDFVAVDTGSCSPRFLRSTVNLVPTNAGVREASAIPLGVAVTPLARVGRGERPVRTVDFGDAGPPRCRGCRAYVNPFVEWKDAGHSWECNFCGADNETAPEYVSPLDYDGRRRDRESRPELRMGSVDFLAPPGFVDPGCAPGPCFVFVVEVTAASIRTGAADAALDSAIACAREMPSWKGARAGIILFGRAVHFIDGREGMDMAHVTALDIGQGTAHADVRRAGEGGMAPSAAGDGARHGPGRPGPGGAKAGAGGAGSGDVGAGAMLVEEEEAREDDDDGFCGLGPDAWVLPLTAPEGAAVSSAELRSRFQAAAERARDTFVRPHRAALWAVGSDVPPPAADGGDDATSPAPYACTGSALAAAVAALDEIKGPPGTGGGRAVVFASSLPRAGLGALPPRELGRMYGGELESALLSGPSAAGGGGILGGEAPDEAATHGAREAGWWTRMAVKCADARVCVDMVLCGRAWMDPALLERPAHATGGSLLQFPELDGPINHRQRNATAQATGAPPPGSASLPSPPKSGAGSPPSFGGEPVSPTVGDATARAADVEHGRAEDGATATLPASGPFSLPSVSARIATELKHLLCGAELGWGCVLKLRASAGLRVGTYSCNAFPRSGGSEADVACVGQDWTAMVALDFDGTSLQPDDELYLQAALLWTGCDGSTRIRVHTLGMRATMDVPDVFRCADAEATMLFLAHQAARRARERPVRAVVEGLKDSLRAILLAYRMHCSRDSPLAQLILPESLKTLPLLCSSLLKSPALMLNDTVTAAGSDDFLLGRARCRATERVPELHRVRGMSPRQVVRYLYPRVLRLIDMDDEAGTLLQPSSEDGRQHVALPDLVWPAADQLLSEGAWLVEWRDFILIVVGADAPEDQCVELFGKPVEDIVDSDELLEPEDGEAVSPLNERLWAILDELTQQREGIDLPIGLVPPNSALRAVVETAMVEDRRDGGPSYADLLCDMHNQVQQHLQAAGPYDF